MLCPLCINNPLNNKVSAFWMPYNAIIVKDKKGISYLKALAMGIM